MTDNVIQTTDGSEIGFSLAVNTKSGKTFVKIGDYEFPEEEFQRKATKIIELLNPYQEV